MNTRIVKLVLFTMIAFAASVSAQRLKPTEIIYSRLPTNPGAPPTGANSPTIWAVGQDGSNDRFITNGTMPSISDDGRFLLFKRFSIPTFFDPFWIYPEFFIRDLSTGQETMIIPPSFDEPSAGHFFSPESNQGNYEIVYDCGERLCKINRDGTNRFRFPWLNANYSYDNFPAVRRGGDQLIALSNNAITPDVGGLYTVDISGTPRQKIPNTTCLDFYPEWSNDNQFIAFGTIYTACNNNFPSLSTYPYWISNLFRIKPDGTGRQQLTNFASNPDCGLQSANCLALGFLWSENNSKLIASGRINGVKGLFAFDTNGSGSFTQIPISPGNAPDFVGGIVQPRVEQNVMSIGGGVTTGGNYSLVSTIGEPVAGITSTSGQYSFESGFWAIPGTGRKSPFDFDGDGKTDVSVFRPSLGQWWVYRSSDGGNLGVQFGASTDVISPGDFTGDGKTDMAFFRPSTGQWFVLRSEDFSFYGFQFGTNGDIPTPADFDGDGKTDVAVFRPSSAAWYVFRSSDSGVTALNFGLSTDKPAAADYDGDGKADVAVWRPNGATGGEWWILKSSTGSVYGASFGTSTDKTVQGDYTGDGKADIAFFRPSTGFWYVLRSEDFSFYGFPFGTNGDTPAPGDYDGDGKTDAAVFRQPGAQWFVNSSSGTPFSLSFGAPGDAPVPNAFVR